MQRFAALLCAGLRELYRKPFNDVEHPRGDEENAGHFRKKSDAAPAGAIPGALLSWAQRVDDVAIVALDLRTEIGRAHV